MSNFWQKLKQPIFALAPMEAVTDVVFREIFARYGKPDIMFTEFVNVDGLLHPEGFERLKLDLRYTENQRPIVAQIWGRDPEKFYRAARLVASLGFDGVDINMGCPQDKEVGQKTCAYLIREPELAKEIVEAAKRGAGDIPVSVKTRIGYSVPETERWIGNLLSVRPAAITVHGRTKKEKSKVPAHWEEIKKAVEVRNVQFPASSFPDRPLILGNGDIQSREEALRRITETGADGVMIARGAFGNPWLFTSEGGEPSVGDRLLVMLEHAALYEKEFSTNKPFLLMRKNFKAYCSGFPGASELRAKLMEVENTEQAKGLVEEFLKLK